MKKRIIALFFCPMLVLVMLLSSCSAPTAQEKPKIGEKTEVIHSKTGVGSYSLFRTQNVQEYLDFLENFNETKYKIVDISTSLEGFGSVEFYIVTYRTIAE